MNDQLSAFENRDVEIAQSNDQDDLLNLAEVEIPIKIHNTATWSEKNLNSNILTIQINLLISSILSVFYPDEPHIMTKIICAFKDVISLSPKLFPSLTLQTLFNIILAIPSIIIISLNAAKRHYEIENPRYEKFYILIKKIMNVFTIFINVHTGAMFGYLVGDFSTNIPLGISALVVQLIWHSSLLELDYLSAFGHDFSPVIAGLFENSPALVFGMYSVAQLSFPRKASVYIYTIPILLMSLITLYCVAKTSWFVGNRKKAATTVGCFMIFVITNLLQYLIPSKTVYWLTVCYILINVLAIFGEWKLPAPVIKKSRKINKENRQTYNDGPNETEVRPKNKIFTFEPQDFATLFVFVFGILLMTYFNAMAARQMPIGQPLPDFIHNIFNTGHEIRGSKTFLEMQFSNMLCVVYIAYSFILVLAFPDVTNARKFLILYGVECVIRAFSFIITSMPAPCTGLPNCPCADPKELARIRALHPLKIALTWTFGFGMFAKLPQCGDLIVSGHTMFMWQTSRWIMEVTQRILPTWLSFLVKLASYYTFLTGICYITLSRNHYTIDIWFGFIISEACFYIYGMLEEKVEDASNNQFMVRVLRWFETRKIPILKEPYEIEEPSEKDEA
ncbi:hypothetical protein TVAG_227650 [Trichomonas vaginalis G3]|uniref:Sphingomyelin synthase-like domain-containing protein n=1 Tax=Trichomonas vaginalis (strain ATCC PRA-98 / G3) TaxID=412133 RepID=A2ERR7_TRIV3|nr:sphingomyelin synthase-related protein 1 family [Trichomonas vaginalis G3]EAY04648.1 hypothetical protein TVAG_227650 [Trichomonas vaginalis G3]KAI5549423.1 sphingomyelin synthase-related protein 1 family [Trichomonas vaginalis G3]|eukprot:XP_001316871.1 hypothetical protein [Trichomonas vaginalis G3]